MEHSSAKSGNGAGRAGLLAVAIILAAAGAHGQADSPATIESEGHATIETKPEYAEFWLNFRVTGAHFTESAKKTLSFEEDLEKVLDALDLDPDTSVVSGAGIRDLQAKETIVSARLRYQLLRHAGQEEKLLFFASLCDKMKAAGQSLACTVEGPFLGVEAREPVEQEAVARATENALYKAEAVAGLMESQIYAVEKVIISSVEWNEPGEGAKTFPDLERLTCRAGVRVLYRYGAY